MNEADFKRKMVESVRKRGGWARRFEDNFAVGLFDCIFVPYRSQFVYFVELKIATPNKPTIEPRPRQMVEARTLKAASCPNAVVCMASINQNMVITVYDHDGTNFLSETAIRLTDFDFGALLHRYKDARRD